TAPAVAFQAASGALLMHFYRWPLDSDWSLAVWGLFVLAGAFWLPVLWIQVRLHRDARAAAAVAALPARFRALFRLWLVLGALAVWARVGVFWLVGGEAPGG